MKLNTTINGGLPVKASGEIVRCPPHEYPGHDYIQDLEVFFLSGHQYWRNLSDQDESRIVEQFFEEVNDGMETD